MCAVRVYGYRRKTGDLKDLGSKIYIDHDRKRRDRADLLRDLQDGDIVRVLYLRDLGGSPVADEKYKRLIQERGATLEIHRPEKAPSVMGRPRKFKPTPEQAEKIRAVWLDETRSLADRCDGVTDIYGARVPRFTLYREYGKPGKPR